MGPPKWREVCRNTRDFGAARCAKPDESLFAIGGAMESARAKRAAERARRNSDAQILKTALCPLSPLGVGKSYESPRQCAAGEQRVCKAVDLPSYGKDFRKAYET